MTNFVRKVKQTAQTLRVNQALVNRLAGLMKPVDDCTHVIMLANNGLSGCKVYIYFHLDRLVFGGFCNCILTFIDRAKSCYRHKYCFDGPNLTAPV